MERQAAHLGHDLIVYRLGASSLERLVQILRARNPAGIVLGRIYSEEFVERFPFGDYPGVAMALAAVPPPYDLVITDTRSAVETAWAKAWERGYRRIGLIVQKGEIYEEDRVRLSAFYFLRKHSADGLAACEPLELGAGPGLLSRAAQKRTAKWIESERPDAVLGLNDIIYYLICALGLRVPEDLGFASLIGTPGVHKKPLCQADRNNDFIAAEAIKHLDHKIQRRERGGSPQAKRILIQPIWKEGVTLPTRAG